MFPILQIGPLAIQLPGLLLLLGVWLGTIVAERFAGRFQVSTSAVSNMIFYALIGGVIGARLGYALRFLDLYLEAPLGIFALNPNTLSLLEGSLTAAIVAIIFGQRRKLPFWRTLDVLAPGIAVLMIFVGFAHLSSGDAFGSVSTLPFAINLWGAQRHPTQIYEIVVGVPILLVLLRISAKTPFDGFLSLVYILLAGISRFVLEAFRGDSVILSGSIRSAQAISLIVVLGALIALHRLARNTSLVT